MWTTNLFSLVIALLGLSWSCIGLYRFFALSKGYVASLNERSSHTVSTPTGAGIIFILLWFGLLAYQCWYELFDGSLAIVFLPALLLAYVGMKDERENLSAKTRFIVQSLAAAFSLCVLGDLGITTIWGWPIPFGIILVISFVSILWMINLVNFMDGTDGLAGSGCAIVFGVVGYLLWEREAYELAIMLIGMSALLCGFLIWNWPRARIFMGDSGSGALGFIMVVFAFITQKYLQFPITVWLILSSCFWFDATITLLRRFCAGEKWQCAHKKHAYQRLVQAGWSHHHVLLAFIVLNAAMGGLGIWAYHNPVLLPAAFGISVCLLMSVYLLIELKKPMFSTWYKV